MQFLWYIFIAHAFCGTFADKLDDVNGYLDKVLSVYIPQEVETRGLEVYEMPNFSHNLQDRKPDGAVVNTKILYHLGNLTGLQNIYRKSCEQPTWTSGNISIVCNVVISQIDVNYQVRFQESMKFTEYGLFREHEYGVSLIVLDPELKLEITSSPHVNVPALKKIVLVNQGEPTIRFDTNENILFDDLSRLFLNKYSKIFEDLIYGPYKAAVENAIESVNYPDVS